MKKTILVLLVLFSTKIMAYQYTVSKITIMNTNPSSAIIELKDTHANNDYCTHAASPNTLILPLTEKTKAMYSALLTGTVSGKTVRILYDGCLAGLPTIIRVDIVNK